MILTVEYQEMLLRLNKYYDVIMADSEYKEVVLQRTLKLGNIFAWLNNYDNEKVVDIIYDYAASYVSIKMIEKVNRRETLHITWD